MSIDPAEVRKAVITHYDAIWNRHEKEIVDDPSWTVRSVTKSFRVCRVHPGKENPIEPYVYLSLGASELTAGSGTGLEFFLLSRDRQDEHVKNIAEIGARHANIPGGLTPGSVLPMGRPLLKNATVDHLLVTLPYPYGPALEEVASPPGTQIRVLWLLPITRSEASFAKKNGVEALEQKFESVYMDFTEFGRASVV